MTPSTYAKISNGLVVNIQLALPTDYFDPAFTWVVIDGLLCVDGMNAIQIGCSYDGTNFIYG